MPSWIRFHGGSPEWVADKQRVAEAFAARAVREGRVPSPESNLLIGTTTASGRTVLPVSWLASLPGASGEARRPGDPKYDRLNADVAKCGFDHAKAGTVCVYVNHRGRAFVYEGNTRITVAAAHGVQSLAVEVQWLNGGEQVDGDASPAALTALSAEAAPIPLDQHQSARKEDSDSEDSENLPNRTSHRRYLGL